MEEFKPRHREVDVQKARAEVRRPELENLRYAGRIMAGQRGGPEVDKLVQVDGGPGIIITPDP